jgi:RNA polymerase sigma-70 factor (ECF subfamily)
MTDHRDSKARKRGAAQPKLDRADFDQYVEPYRREMRLHCYRMIGSPHEAEDLVQETYLRAWRSFDSFEGRGSLRSWLYQIATNVCLNALASRKDRHRLLPDQRSLPAHDVPSGAPPTEIKWLAPYPDSQLLGIVDEAPGPAARYESRESIQLAFVALIQQLPPRQRAIVLLCEVLGWSADEAASLLGGSIASVNSALQRGRATLSKRYPDDRPRKSSSPDHAQRALIERYVRAWEGYDLDGFVSLLKEDSTYAMPPWEQWYRGRDSIRTFFSRVWGFYGGFRLLPTRANGQPAFALYSCKHGAATFHAHSLHVLEIQGNSISSLTAFMKPPALELFSEFDLPLTVSDIRQ